MNLSKRFLFFSGLSIVAILISTPLFAQDPENSGFSQSAPVIIDGNTLFDVPGVTAYPAKRRAAEIRERIIALAKDPKFSVDSLTLEESNQYTKVMAGDQPVATVFELEAKLRDIPRNVAAHIAMLKIREAIQNYRQYREPEVLRRGLLYSAGATVLLGALIFFFIRIFRKAHGFVERRYSSRIQTLKVGSMEVLRAEHLRSLFTALVRGLQILIIFTLLYSYLEFVLIRFPWTRGIATRLIEWVADPLRTIGVSIVEYLPNFFFLLVLFFVTILGLKLIRLLFAGLEQGAIKFSGFEPEWAKPTFNLIRLLIIAFFLVVAYPYIPGSESAAFKGISIFLGVLISLGSSSAISNLIAGYSMIYRGTFKIGDKIQVGEFCGIVTASRLLTTQLRTIKNERVIVPNSLILNSSVVNYSTLAKEKGLILHSTVGIGYETPWRQVEAILKLAADRTPGLLKEPSPFVHQKALGDFAVNYEINAYCHDPLSMATLYTALHQNILDLFNEHNIQIMTPAYEGDPETAKVVPKDQWYAAPAEPPPPQKAK